MKEREPTQPRRDPELEKERSIPETEPLLVEEDRSSTGDSPDEDQYNALATTRVTTSPLESDSEDALSEDRDGESDSGPKSGPSSKRTRSALGDFLLVRKLGQGAMATVYKARQLSFDRKVALKLLHKHVADNPKLVERFYREARTLGQLDHPNIVQGYGVGQVEGFHYFAMEYISGASLQLWLNKLGRLPTADALHITISCAQALEYAHDHGLIHRDIKPDNVLITKKGVVKVADLGMVKAMDEDMSLTQTGHAVGTPWYMPLEQAKNAKDVDGRCDIYAMGCMLYYMLTGRPPFRGNSIVEVIQAKEIGTFPPARQSNSEVPERLDLIIAKMTAKYPKHRYQHCREVIRDLEELGLAAPELTVLRKTGSDEESITPPSLPALDTPVGNRSLAAGSVEWYLQSKDSSGDLTTRKYSTAQIFKMLESGQVSPNSKASRTENGIYRSLATYKEFESVALALATKTSMDRQTVKYRELYKKLEEQDLQREQKKLEDQEMDKSILHAARMALPIAGFLVGGILLLWLIIYLVRMFTG